MCADRYRILFTMAQSSVRLKRSLDSLAELHSATIEFTKQSSLSTSQANELAVILEELFVNAVRHSTGRRGDVEVHLSKDGNNLSVHFVDMEVDRFDITTQPLSDLELPIEQRRPGGMGLHLIRQFADQISYQYENGNGIITIEKKLGK